MSEKISIPKLIGQSNYEVWSLWVESLLIKGSLGDAIEEEATPKPEVDQKALANFFIFILYPIVLYYVQYCACSL